MLGCSGPRTFCRIPKRLLKERFGFGVVPDLLEKEPEVIQVSGGLGVIGTQSVLCHFNRSFRNGYRLLDIFLVQSVGLLADSVRLGHPLRPTMPRTRESTDQALTAQPVIFAVVEP